MIRVICLAIVLVFSGCNTSDNSKVTTLSGIAMTMPYRIMVGKPHAKGVQKIIDKTFAEIHDIYNKWNPHSEISQLNRAATEQKIPISGKLEQFLKEADRMVKLSRGKFDPTVEIAQQLWKEKLQQGQTPSKEEIEAIVSGIGWNKIHFEEGFFWKDRGEICLDLGGIAKGYALDLIVERLNQEGYSDVYAEWGGEIRVSGKHPEGRPWKVLVSKFGTLSTPLVILDLQDEAVASSGDYIQNWTIKDTNYFHIFDPRTGHPLIATRNTICSATVVAPSCMLADVLATVSMMFPSPEAAKEWLGEVQKNIPGIKFWIFSRNDSHTAQE